MRQPGRAVMAIAPGKPARTSWLTAVIRNARAKPGGAP
jgi:hypothetical protein